MAERKIMKAPSEMVAPHELRQHIDDNAGPWYLSEKLDGYHCIIKEGRVHSSSMKTDVFRNTQLHKFLAPVVEWAEANGWVLCGELYSPLVPFNELGALRGKDNPLPRGLRFCLFDMLTVSEWNGLDHEPCQPFGTRSTWMDTLRYDIEHDHLPDLRGMVEVIDQKFVVRGEGDLAEAQCERWLNSGSEGAMLHHADGIYKHGRVSRKDARLLKVKAFDPHDAVIIGVEEGLKTPDGLERERQPNGSLKPIAKGQKVPSGSFGRFKIRVKGGPFDGLITYVGRWKGWTQKMADEIWADPEAWIGQWLRFRAMRGAKDLPRIPKDVEFRDPK